MMAKLLTLGVLAAATAAAQSNATRFWFPDGAGVELRTETTGSTLPTELGGGGRVGPGGVSRFVEDGNSRTIFAYGLELRKTAERGTVRIRLNPLAGDPTLAAVREFNEVRIGQEVKIEILANPSTGERVYDVLRPVEGPSPSPGGRAIQGVTVPKLVVNGQEAAVKSTWVDGPARLYVPRHGAYFLAWQSKPNYRLAGYVEGNRLIFLMDSEYVEMTFPPDVRQGATGGPVWIYHDPNFVPENHGGTTCLLDSY